MIFESQTASTSFVSIVTRNVVEYLLSIPKILSFLVGRRALE